jgi:hypothetical protein
MGTPRLAVLTTVVGAPHARVLAARLGAEGIPVELAGMTSAVYPLLGAVDLLVREEHLRLAREILLADAVDAVFDGLDGAPSGHAGSADGGRADGGDEGSAGVVDDRATGGKAPWGRPRLAVVLASLLASALLLAGALVALR